MSEPLEPWWAAPGLLTHPLAAAERVDPGARWRPTPAPAPRVDTGPRTYRIAWSLQGLSARGMDVEVVGDLLVLRAIAGEQAISRAVPLPADGDLARRRDHWRDQTLEVVVPRIRPTPLRQLRMWLARLLRRVAALLTPHD